MLNFSRTAAGMLALVFSAGLGGSNPPALAVSLASWEIKATNEAPAQLHRGDELTLAVTCASAKPVGQVMIKVDSERVIRADTIYIGPLGAYTGVEVLNFETRPALSIKQTLAFKALPNAANTYRAELRIPLTAHEYGLCEMTVSLPDADGKELMKKKLGYSVVVTLPLDQPGTIAGFDNWAGPGNHGQMPTDNQKYRRERRHAYQISTWSAYKRASTFSPISRLSTEYTLRST